MMPVGGITWTDDDMLAEIERLTAENRRYEKYIDIQANEILEHEQTIATLTAELEAALHGTVTTKYHDDLMHQWHVKVVDLEAEVERLSAELEHHKGKAEVWEDAARAAQARVEALEVVKDAAQSFIDGEGWESLYELSGALSNLAATEHEGE